MNTTPTKNETGNQEYLHRVTGIYQRKTDAEAVLEQLIRYGFKSEQLEIFVANNAKTRSEAAPDSDEVRNEVMVDGAIGTAIGTGIGALGEMALAAANVSLFVASPIIGTLAMMGWGAVMGGIIGATVGAGDENTRHFSDLVRDAVGSGHAVLVVHANTEEQTTTAQAVIGNSLKDPSQASRIDLRE